jgi:hypothetical protein
VPNIPHLLSVAALAAGLGASGQLEAVRRAQGLLEPRVWTEVIRIDNSNPSSRYPRAVDALVFELDSVLWLYTPTDGTQSLSLYRNRAEMDKANLGPLLAAIDEGFTRWEVLPRPGGPLLGQARPPNGCFIESIAILLRRLDYGASVENPRLLSYYVSCPGGMRGHTVLQFTTGGQVQVVDPDRPNRVIRISHADPDDPKNVADRIRGDVARARHLPLGEFLDRAPAHFLATLQPHASKNDEQALPAQADAPRPTRS